MSIARLADRVLQRLVPAVEAGACEHSPCYCQTVSGYCRWIYTNCAGTRCSVVGGRCPAC